MVDSGTEFISGSFVTTHPSDNYNRSCQKKKKAKKLFVVHASERLICCFPSSIGIHEPSFKSTRLQKAVLPCFRDAPMARTNSSVIGRGSIPQACASVHQVLQLEFLGSWLDNE